MIMTYQHLLDLCNSTNPYYNIIAYNFLISKINNGSDLNFGERKMLDFLKSLKALNFYLDKPVETLETNVIPFKRK